MHDISRPGTNIEELLWPKKFGPWSKPGGSSLPQWGNYRDEEPGYFRLMGASFW